MENIVDIITANGYEKTGYGYKKTTKDNIHWITLFKDCLQMYSYHKDDGDYDKQNDTGIIRVTGDELQTLIKVLVNNHL
jgi:hypothetical protein